MRKVSSDVRTCPLSPETTGRGCGPRAGRHHLFVRSCLLKLRLGPGAGGYAQLSDRVSSCLCGCRGCVCPVVLRFVVLQPPGSGAVAAVDEFADPGEGDASCCLQSFSTDVGDGCAT